MSRLTVGLTGGIASGKSAVAARFSDLGVPVLDADQVSRDVVVPGSAALTEISGHFGPGFLSATGELDRRKMREHVFSDAPARQALEAILHPRIFEALRLWRDAQQAPYCILSVAILLESRMKTLMDRVLVVDTPVETQQARLIQRDGIPQQLALSMIAAQITREARLAAADDVIRNDGSLDDMTRQVTDLHRRYLQLAAV